jgi:thioredoxin 1
MGGSRPVFNGTISTSLEREPDMADGIVTLTTATFDEAVASSDKPVVVDFWAEWCGPCKMIAPILGEIASEQSENLTIAKLNVDENPDLAMRFNVMSIPTLLVFDKGSVAKRLVGREGQGRIAPGAPGISARPPADPGSARRGRTRPAAAPRRCRFPLRADDAAVLRRDRAGAPGVPARSRARTTPAAATSTRGRRSSRRRGSSATACCS